MDLIDYQKLRFAKKGNLGEEKYPQLGIFWVKLKKVRAKGGFLGLMIFNSYKFFGKLAETKKQIPSRI